MVGKEAVARPWASLRYKAALELFKQGYDTMEGEI